MIPQRVPSPLDNFDYVCAFAVRWILSIELAERIQVMQANCPFMLSIFSGYRTDAHQLELIRDGEATLAPAASTHCSCPSTGADLNVDAVVADTYVKNLFGQAAFRAGLRWGGGARFENGIPVGDEWHHVDLGPRKE